MHRAIFVVTLLVLTIIKTVLSQDRGFPMEQCTDVFESFMPCMGFIEGMFIQPSPQCCRSVTHLNNIVKFTSPRSRKEKGENNNNNNIGEVERVCECVEIMGKANHLPFIPTAINNLPLFCSLTLSFPISVAMDCSQFRNTRGHKAGKLN
ncbi:unnamed protein product [Cochlearia groenlandica]